MQNEHVEARVLRDAADASLQGAAGRLRDILRTLAGRLKPFPAFMNMTSIQAVEIQPQGLQASSRGCVVVCPDGELYELSLRLLPGPSEISDVDQVEEFEPLDLRPEEYIPYAYAAINALSGRLEP